MNLTAETCLRGVLTTLNERIAPAVNEGFAVEVMRLAGLVLSITTNSLDNAAALRVAENEAMRQLFRDAAGVVDDAALAQRLRDAADAAASGLRISELDAENDQSRRLLVDLHIHTEDMADQAWNHRIWRMLRDFEAARAPQR